MTTGKPLYKPTVLRGRTTVSVIILTLALCSCSKYSSDWPEVVRKNIFVPTSARISKAKMYRGMYGMKYNVGESYPSVGYITAMVTHMSGLGWRRLDYDFIVSKNRLNHALGSNGKWDEYTDEKGYKVESWIDDWQDASGNVVRYNLKHRVGPNENKQTASDLEVVATYIPEKIKEKISSSFTSTQSFE